MLVEMSVTNDQLFMMREDREINLSQWNTATELV